MANFDDNYASARFYAIRELPQSFREKFALFCAPNKQDHPRHADTLTILKKLGIFCFQTSDFRPPINALILPDGWTGPEFEDLTESEDKIQLDNLQAFIYVCFLEKSAYPAIKVVTQTSQHIKFDLKAKLRVAEVGDAKVWSIWGRPTTLVEFSPYMVRFSGANPLNQVAPTKSL